MPPLLLKYAINARVVSRIDSFKYLGMFTNKSTHSVHSYSFICSAFIHNIPLQSGRQSVRNCLDERSACLTIWPFKAAVWWNLSHFPFQFITLSHLMFNTSQQNKVSNTKKRMTTWYFNLLYIKCAIHKVIIAIT